MLKILLLWCRGMGVEQGGGEREVNDYGRKRGTITTAALRFVVNPISADSDGL